MATRLIIIIIIIKLNAYILTKNEWNNCIYREPMCNRITQQLRALMYDFILLAYLPLCTTDLIFKPAKRAHENWLKNITCYMANRCDDTLLFFKIYVETVLTRSIFVNFINHMLNHHFFIQIPDLYDFRGRRLQNLQPYEHFHCCCSHQHGLILPGFWCCSLLSLVLDACRRSRHMCFNVP